MSRSRAGRRMSYLALTALLVAGGALARPEKVGPRVTTQELGGGDRYLTYLSTDKPIYKAGEQVYLRGVVLDARTHAPLVNARHATVEILGPKGETVTTGSARAQDGVLGFAWPVNESLAGGEYTAKVTFVWEGLPTAERKFDVRIYRAPRLKSQIVFVRDGYGPGDSVGATLHTERAEGGIPQGAEVAVEARVDGAVVFTGKTKVDGKGNAETSFPLPKEIAVGDGTLAFTIEDGGVVETATKTIPILLQTLDLAVYPEGGELVAGLENRVYVQARTPAQKPADIAAVVVDARGQEVTRFSTEHEGRGRFSFKPEQGQSYQLRLEKPAGISKLFPLPAVVADGAVLKAVDEVVPAGRPVRLLVGKSSAGKAAVTLSQREVEVAAVKLDFAKRSFWHRGYSVGELNEVVLTPPATVDGVLVATVWDANGAPLAERLVFVAPAKPLQITVKPSKPSYVTGDTVELTVETTDANGKPVGAFVGLTVTDDAVLEMIEKREQAPRLPAMVFLENDVQELRDAHVYLDPKHPKGALAVDLLLGTQGWRRFALVSHGDLLAQHGDPLRRALAIRRPAPPPPPPNEMMGFEAEAAPRAAAPMADRAPGVRRSRAAPPPPRSVAKMGAPPPAKPAARPEPAAPQAAKERPAPAGPRPEGKVAAKADVARRAPRGAAGLRARDLALGEEFIPFGGGAGGFVWVREYAHQARPGRKPNDRVDFTETVFWSAATRTDEQSGKASVRFALSDSVTTFRVFADGFSLDGAVGAGEAALSATQPFYIEPKMPLQVSSTDVIKLPVSVVNGTANDLRGKLELTRPKGFRVDGLGGLTAKANARGRQLVTLEVGNFVGTAELEVAAKVGPLSDSVTRPLVVKPLGFPIEIAHGGMLEPGKPQTFAVDVPQTVVPGSLETAALVFPTPLANLTQALARLLQEPYGCFEQTSSTTYPLVMAQQYFTTHTGVDAALIERSSGLLQKGYDRLRTFECKKKGYEWFGEDPGHEALSAFGLMEFNDMAKVREVDGAMLAATRKWLLGRRDGKGGFTSERRALHTWLVEPDLHNGYITWAMLEADENGIGKEATAFTQAALASKDSYVMALGANVAAMNRDMGNAKTLMNRLRDKQTADGYVDGAKTTVVGSRGESLLIETTSLATLAWLREPSMSAPVERAIQWLAKVCEGGRFGSTQATVLALRAIITYDKARAKPKAPGSVTLTVDGKPVGAAFKFDQSTKGTIELPPMVDWLTPGRHQVKVAMNGGAPMPFALTVRYNTNEPVSSPETRVFLTTTLKNRKLDEGGVTEIDVTVANITDEPLPMTVALVGVPGGLEVRHDQLKELKRAGRIAAYEVLGREVVLYWREMKPKQSVQLPISLVAAIPGTYTGPASRAYEYYADEFKVWNGGLKVEITPRATP